jgi:hypothetical protein
MGSPTNQLFATSLEAPFANCVISPRLRKKLISLVHVKSFLVLPWILTVLIKISRPLFSVLPMFLTIALGIPDVIGKVWDSNKELVFCLYTSIDPEIRFLNNPKSTPMFVVDVFSHVRESLEALEK